MFISRNDILKWSWDSGCKSESQTPKKKKIVRPCFYDDVVSN